MLYRNYEKYMISQIKNYVNLILVGLTSFIRYINQILSKYKACIFCPHFMNRWHATTQWDANEFLFNNEIFRCLITITRQKYGQAFCSQAYL